MPSFKRINVAEARQMLLGKHLSYTYSKDGELDTILITEVKYYKGLFRVIGSDEKGNTHEIPFGGGSIVWLSEHGEYEAFTNSEVRPFYAKYILKD